MTRAQQHCTHRHWFLVLGLGLLSPVSAMSQETLGDWLGGMVDAAVKEASQWELDPEAMPLEVVDVGEANRVLGVLQRTLASGSLEDLATLRPYAEEALAYVEAVPALSPTASWLRERMDYFLVAEEVVEHRRRPTPVQPVRERPEPPPAPSRPAPVPPPSEGDFRIWLNRLEGRQPPSRAATYVPRLKPVFRNHGVPEEMVWLAEVESSFNPAARSPVGAAGLYQFMPATAKEYGLSLSPTDQRLDPDRNADAAARYLKKLHNRFGDWQLALAAYNAGQGRVGRLLRETGGAGFEDIAVHLPAETRMYVPKMRAVVQVREGVDLRRL